MLDGDPAVTNWDTDLDDPRKLLRVDLTADGRPRQIVELLAKAGFVATQIENGGEPAVIGATTSANFKLSTYKPLLLVVAYVIGATVFAESIHGRFEWHRAMGYFMGFFFLAFAFFKLLNVSGFADAFATYDILANRTRFYGLVYPFVELSLGLLFLTHSFPLAANLATAIVMGVGLVGVVSAVRRKQAIQCACLGTVFNLPMSVVTIVENSLMISMAVLMLFSGQ